MDYEKKYKEALEWARKVMQGKVGFVLDEVLEKFPELKESEDERIRKALIHLISEQDGFLTAINGVNVKDIIAWLEKQGKNNIGISESAKQNLEDNLSKALEKETPESWNKFLDEQKPGDKAEPMFKVGDFIANDYCFGKVIALTDDAYLLDTEQGIPFSCEHNAHLWTIKDAKDGDVLIDEEDENPFIFKGLLDKHHPECPVAYCGIDFYGTFVISSSSCSWWAGGSVYPATKEQCDLLFQKMKEAGYEWDAEKKELKKIEQKPTDKEMKIILQTEYEKGRADAIAEMQKPVNIDYISGIRKELLGIEDNAENINGLTESQWVAIRAAHRLLSEYITKEQNSAWSEEDDIGLSDALLAVEQARTIAKDENDMGNIWYAENWLKSLKERYAWKKSLATAGLENSLCDIQDGYSDTSYEYRILGEAIEFIRCTEPQPHWKPSDEQIKALEHFVRSVGESGYASPYDNNTKLLYSLLSDLKKLK